MIHVYACKTDNCAGPGDMTHEREQARHGQYENEPTIEAQHEARMREQQLHGWSRAKKEALIRRDIETLKQLSKKKVLS